MKLNLQSGSGKWWSSLQGRGEVDGGIRHLGEYPKQCWIKTTIHNALAFFQQKKCSKHFIGQSAVCLTVSFRPADNTTEARDTNI